MSSDKELNVLWCSCHPSMPTGYGKVSFELLKNMLSVVDGDKLEIKHKNLHITHYSLYSVLPENSDNTVKFCRPILYGDNISYSNYCTKEDGMGLKNFKEQVKQCRPDIIFIYNGAVEMSQLISVCGNIIPEKTEIIVYYDTYYGGMYKDIVSVFNNYVHKCIVFSDFQKKKCLDAGMDIPIYTLAHGIDPEMHEFVPSLEAKAQINVPITRFMCSVINTNQPRKRYDVLFQAWAMFCKNWQEQHLEESVKMLKVVETALERSTVEEFMKTERSDIILKHRIPLLVVVTNLITVNGWDIIDLVQRCFMEEFNIDKDGALKIINKHIAFIDTKETPQGDGAINMFNCATDLGINVADGEGVGLTPLEQSYVGVPQLIGNFSGAPHILPPNESIDYINVEDPKGIVTVDYSIKLMNTFNNESFMEYKYIINPKDVADALMKLYHTPEYLAKSRDVLRKYYEDNADKYDWNAISDRLYDIFLEEVPKKERPAPTETATTTQKETARKKKSKLKRPTPAPGSVNANKQLAELNNTIQENCNKITSIPEVKEYDMDDDATEDII